ncbi:ABC transporter substrate-binding protein [Halorussus sp. AFM4]|uniref:ABC transporter substrate-binding protein n=1 Tax=Halorussus sp. AFM4 TaxID=3421651 RepID=UPI003EBA3E57
MAQNRGVVDSGVERDGVNRRDFLKAAGGGATATGLTGYLEYQGKPTIEIWLSYYTEGKTKRLYTNKIVNQFENQTGISINITGVPYTDVLTKFRAARASGDVPHLIEVMTRPGILAGDAGLIVNDLWQSSELADKTADKIMKGHKVWGAQSTGEQGNLVTFPLGYRPYFSAWRKDWLNQANIEPSEVNYKAGSLHWRKDVKPIYERLNQTQLGQREGYYPDTTGMKQSDEEYMSLYIPQHGGSLSGVVNVEGTEATIDSKAAREAIKMQFEFIDEGLFHENSINHGDEEATTLHWSGKTAVNHIQDSTDLWGDYLEEQRGPMMSGDYTWGLPMNAGNKAALAWLPSLGFIKDAFSGQREKDAAVRFLEWWIGDDQRAVQNSKKLGFVPVTPQTIQEEDFFGKTQTHKEFWRGACLKTLREFRPAVIPAVPSASAITYEIPRTMHQRISQMLGRGTGLDTAVNKATSVAADEINRLLQENRRQ